MTSTPAEGTGSPVTVCPTCSSSFFDPGITHCPTDGAYLLPAGETSTRVDRVVGGRYRLINCLGQGAMGTVYLAEHGLSGRRCALKIIRPELESSQVTRDRFLRECHALERIASPHVVSVLESGASAAGEIFLVMELLEGRELRARIVESALSVAETVRIGTQIAAALAAAHEQNIVHRDLKPENVFLCTSGPVKVLDFGLARLIDAGPLPGGSSKITAIGTVVGTPVYMSPEAIEGAPEPSSDLYSLGIILYEMIAGKPPFFDEELILVMGMHLRQEPPPLPRLVPAALEQLIFGLLRKSPAERPASAGDVKRALEEIAAAPIVPPPQPQPVSEPVPQRKPRRLWPFVVIGCVFLGAVVTAASLGAWLAQEEDVPAPIEQAVAQPPPIAAPEPPPIVEPPPPPLPPPPPEPVVIPEPAAQQSAPAPEPARHRSRLRHVW